MYAFWHSTQVASAFGAFKQTLPLLVRVRAPLLRVGGHMVLVCAGDALRLLLRASLLVPAGHAEGHVGLSGVLMHCVLRLPLQKHLGVLLCNAC